MTCTPGGYSIGKDEVLAYMWFYIRAARAKRALLGGDALATDMTAVEIEQARVSISE